MQDILTNAMNYAAGLENVSYADSRAITSKNISMGVSTKEEAAQSGEFFGISVRVLAGGAWGYSSAQSAERAALNKAVDDARKCALAVAATKKEKILIDTQKPMKDKVQVLGKESLFDMPFEEQRKLLHELLDFTKSKTIVFAQGGISASKAEKVFANTEGSILETTIERTRIGMTCVARKAAKQAMNYDVSAAQGGLEKVMRQGLEKFSTEVSKKATLFLSAKTPHAGKTQVLMSPQVAGTLVHEVFGHAVEADWIANGRSLLAKKLNQKMAADTVTIYDDGSIPGAWGSVYYDDEGIKSKKNILLENGVLKQYMHSRESAKKLNMPLTGNGRLQDHTHMIIPRMTNTCMAPGEQSYDEMASSIKKGIIVDKFTCALEDPAGGSFEIKTLGGHNVENGRITTPLNRAAISSSSFLETLLNIVAISKKIGGNSAGMCGKGHENWVPVGNPAPYILINDLTVGGA